MRKILFSPSAIEDFQLFRSGNTRLVFKIFEIISDIQTDPFKGMGKPDPLKGNFKWFWSGRVNDGHRLIYKVTNDAIEIYSCYRRYSQ